LYEGGEPASHAVLAISAIGPDAKAALPLLENSLFTESNIVKQVHIAQAIWRLSRNTNLVFQFYRNALSGNPDDSRAMNAAFALIEIGPAAKITAPILAQLVNGITRSPGICANAAIALGAMDLANEAVIDALVRGIADTDLNVRAACARSLRKAQSASSLS